MGYSEQYEPSVGGAVFTPGVLIVEYGQTVTWWNVEDLNHTVTAYEHRLPDGAAYFDSGGFPSEDRAREYTEMDDEMGFDDRFEHTFETPGHHHYFCIPHEDFDTMAGTVVVKNPDGTVPPAPPVVQPETDHVVHMGPWSFFPEKLTIEAGESVGWVNGTGIAHSVTSRRVPDGAEYFASGGFGSEDAAIDDWYDPRRGDVIHDEPFTHTFETPGEYEYYCILHDGNMIGTITVEPSS